MMTKQHTSKIKDDNTTHQHASNVPHAPLYLCYVYQLSASISSPTVLWRHAIWRHRHPEVIWLEQIVGNRTPPRRGRKMNCQSDVTTCPTVCPIACHCLPHRLSLQYHCQLPRALLHSQGGGAGRSWNRDSLPACIFACGTPHDLNIFREVLVQRTLGNGAISCNASASYTYLQSDLDASLR